MVELIGQGFGEILRFRLELLSPQAVNVESQAWARQFVDRLTEHRPPRAELRALACLVVFELEAWAHRAAQQRPRAAGCQPRSLPYAAPHHHLRPLALVQPVVQALSSSPPQRISCANFRSQQLAGTVVDRSAHCLPERQGQAGQLGRLELARRGRPARTGRTG